MGSSYSYEHQIIYITWDGIADVVAMCTTFAAEAEESSMRRAYPSSLGRMDVSCIRSTFSDHEFIATLGLPIESKESFALSQLIVRLFLHKLSHRPEIYGWMNMDSAMDWAFNEVMKTREMNRGRIKYRGWERGIKGRANTNNEMNVHIRLQSSRASNRFFQDLLEIPQEKWNMYSRKQELEKE